MKWRWLAKLFAFFGMCVGLFGIGTFTQVNSISSAITGFFDPEKNATVSILGMDYSIFTVIGSIVLAVLVGLVVIGGLKRIAKVSERVIPAMVVLYVGLSVLLIVTNLDKIPGAFVTIFEARSACRRLRAACWAPSSSPCRRASRAASSRTRPAWAPRPSPLPPLRRRSRCARVSCP